KDRVANAETSQYVQRFQVYRRFRKPHALRLASETELKVVKAPEQLRVFVPAIRKRQDCVVIRLSQRGATPAGVLPALLVRLENHAIGFTLLLRHPGEKGWTEIEIDPRVVVYDLVDLIRSAENTGHPVRRVTFSGNAFVPVVKRIRGV